MNQDGYKIADNLPASLDYDNVKELAKLIDKKLAEVNQMTELVSIYPRIDELSSAMIDALAIQFHVDCYDTQFPLDVRRGLVKKSMRWHIRKGTKASLQEQAETIISGAKVHEWFDYGGEPYFFRIAIPENFKMTKSLLPKFLYGVEQTKNVRSWLERIEVPAKTEMKIHVGLAPQRIIKAEISRADNKNITTSNDMYIGAAVHTTKKITLGGNE